MTGIIIGVLVGVTVALMTNLHIPSAYSIYVSVGILAALDSVCGGMGASLAKNFNLKIFITGLFFNAVVAMGLVYLGKLLGLDLSLAAVVVFGSRIIQNFALIRRLLLNKYEKKDKIVIK